MSDRHPARDAQASPSEPPNADKAVDAALAEFSVLRALMAVRFQIQIVLLTGALTAIGVIAGLALQRNGNTNLLLFVPVLASVVAVLHGEQRSRIGLNGRYIRDCLWPYLKAKTDPLLPSWERYWWEHSNRTIVAIGGVQAVGFLLLMSIVALIVRVEAATAGTGYTVVWWLGAVLTVNSLVYSINVVFRFTRDEAQHSDTDAT